ncbi:MAG: TetR/AcrR family transcriptional regulator [Actinobacteria bacterium]|nr:TetR/AcrR family transcriptional regulator [Actinomycetota bacterium]
MATASTARGRHTRERLLEATANLVAARGFHAVAITDIGAAAGVTGSALYRHFASKQDLLVALLDRVVGDLLTGARAVVDATPSAAEALDALVEAHVAFALRNRNLIRVYDQEADHLPDADRRRIRRAMRTYAEEWVRVLRSVRPGLDEPTARTQVHAAFGLVNSVADYRSPLAEDRLRDLLVGMTHKALGGGDGT